MAIIKFGTIVTNASGKIGGHYFSNSLGGATLATLPRQRKNSSTTSQSSASTSPYNKAAISAALIYVVKSYKLLTAVQKQAWALAAPNFPTVNKLGVPNKPSGYHCYVHINYGYYSNSGTLLTAPPANQAGTTPQQFTFIACSLISITINLAIAVPANYTAYLYATRSMSAGIKPTLTQFSLFHTLGTGSVGNKNVTSEYINKFGYPIVGDTLWIAIKLQNSFDAQFSIAYLTASVIS